MPEGGGDLRRRLQDAARGWENRELFSGPWSIVMYNECLNIHVIPSPSKCICGFHRLPNACICRLASRLSVSLRRLFRRGNLSELAPVPPPPAAPQGKAPANRRALARSAICQSLVFSRISRIQLLSGQMALTTLIHNSSAVVSAHTFAD